jgi:peptidoglycan/xylan/chitin deacetylase (PgdA/CDA1 family)
VFVPTGAIGDRNTWDNESPPAGLEVMSMEELRDVDARGVTVESHGHGHVDLASATATTARDDLARSMAILTEFHGRPPRFLAYPWGQVTPAVERLVRELGFLAAFTIGVRDRGLFARARVPVRAINPAWKFRIQTSGYWSALRFSRIGSPVRAAGRSLTGPKQLGTK